MESWLYAGSCQHASLLVETAMEAPRHQKSSDVHRTAESDGRGDGPQREGSQSILWKYVKPGSHLTRSTNSDFQIFNRKSSFGPQIVHFFNQKCWLSSTMRLYYCCHQRPSWESCSCILGVPGGWGHAGRGGKGRASSPGAGEAPPSRVAAGDIPVPSPSRGWGGCRGLSSTFLSSSSVSHRLRTHQPSFSPASTHHPTAAARR